MHTHTHIYVTTTKEECHEFERGWGEYTWESLERREGRGNDVITISKLLKMINTFFSDVYFSISFKKKKMVKTIPTLLHKGELGNRRKTRHSVISSVWGAGNRP